MKDAGSAESSESAGVVACATPAYGIDRIRSSSCSARWLATSVFSATLTKSREWSKLVTSAMSPTASTMMATISSIRVKPSSRAKATRAAIPRRSAIEVPHVEAVGEDDPVVVAVRQVPAGGHLDRGGDVVRRSDVEYPGAV